MGDQYRKSLDKLSVSQRRKFLEEDWNAHFMLLEMYSKPTSKKTDFETFCSNFCQSLVQEAQTLANQPIDEPDSVSFLVFIDFIIFN